jgi:hypothetical protein
MDPVLHEIFFNFAAEKKNRQPPQGCQPMVADFIS